MLMQVLFVYFMRHQGMAGEKCYCAVRVKWRNFINIKVHLHDIACPSIVWYWDAAGEADY
jgi:hypothetical protein